MFRDNKKADEAIVTSDVQSDDTPTQEARQDDDASLSSEVPLTMKIIAVLLVVAIGFGSHWSSGVTGAMKSTLKKVSTLRSPG